MALPPHARDWMDRGVLTFQGGQGVGKTRWLKRLVPEPMTNDWVKLDHHLDGHNKDSIHGAATHWICEIGELDSTFRKDVGRLKGVLTRDCDKLRLPYARSPIELKRRTVFAATVNEWNFLVDPTGNSRWWTLPVEKLDHEHDVDMQQVFAQLAVKFREGEQWWLDEGEQCIIDSLNRNHQAASVIEERLKERIDPNGKNPILRTASKTLEDIGFRHPSNTQAKEAGAVLRSIYGPPKKYGGIMKWKVALLDEFALQERIPTYAELAKQHQAHAETYQRSHGDVEAILRLHLVPRWGKLKLNEITQQDVAKWLGQKRADGLAPSTVEKIRVTFHRSFELAARWNIAGAVPNPVKGIPRPKFNNSRERYLTASEAARLHTAVAASANPQLANIVGLLLLTGARKMELLRARWEHIDLERKAWLIPDSKTGKARHVPLSQAAIDLIQTLPRWHGCPWLLANPDTKEPFVDIKRAWATARKEAKLPGLRIHDLRHSAASFMINAGIDLFAVGRILGHADHQSTMRYSHLANDTLLAAVEAGAAGLKVDWTQKAA